MVPRTVLTRSGLISLNTARPVNTVKGTRVNTARPKAVLSVVKENKRNDVKASTCWIQVSNGLGPQKKLIFLPLCAGKAHKDLKDKGVIDSGCSRHMTRNRSYLTDYKEIDGGFVAFGGKIRTGNLDFEDVYFVKELKFNLFSVS
ncbi:hypothetical protein Tco_1356691 [Tanacetum coccineum]